MSAATLVRIRRFFSAVSERRIRRLEAGDTLIEVLLALVVLAIASVALIVAFQTSISASSRHRSLASDDAILTTATQEAIYTLQNDASIWKSCANISTYPAISLPSPYAYSIDYAITPGTGATTPTVEYWNGSSFSSTCPTNVATAAQELTIGIVGTNFTNSFVVASPLSISGTSVSTGSATGLFFTTDPSGALAEIPFTTQPVLEIESDGYPVQNDLSLVSLSYTTVGGSTSTPLSCPEANTNGVITFSGCSLPAAGSYTLTATVPTTAGGTLTATYTPLVVGTANYQLAFTAQPAGAASGTAFQTAPVVAVQSTSTPHTTYTQWTGTVTFTDSGGILNCPGDSSTTAVTVTAVNGVATMPQGCTFAGGYLYNPVSNVTLATPYTMTVTATGSVPVAPATSNTFAVSTFGAATQLKFTSQPSGAAASTATAVFPGQPVVTVEDSFGNAVTSGFSGIITLSISNPQGLSPPQGLAGCAYGSLTYGVATFSGCHGTATTYGTGYTMTASTGVSGVASATSAPFNITGLATVLLFTTTGQPVGGLSGSTLAKQPVLEYEDGNGNVVTAETAAVSFTVSTTSTGAEPGVLSTCTGLAPSGGVVTVANCSFTGTVGATYYLTATGGGLSATSNGFYVTGAGPLAQLVFETEPVAGAAGSLMTTQPVIYLEDSAGNLETSLDSGISLTTASGTLTGCSGLSAIDGVVDVSGCSFGGLVGTQYTMTATDGSITGVSTDFSPSGPGPLATITLTGCTTPFNAVTSCTLTATLADAYGNTETSDSSSAVTFAESGTGTVTGLTSNNDSGGIATDVVTGANAGPLTVSASADGITSNTEGLTVYSTSSIAVVSSGSPSVVGQPVTYTATVTPTSTNSAFATGSVEFFDGGAPITGCTAQVLSGTSTDTATCTVTYTSTTGSPHSITAQYLGNPATYFAPSAVSTAISQIVNAAATTTTVVSTTGSPSVVGQPVTFTATVTATSPATGNPTGNVEFFNGGTAITGCTAKALTGTSTDTATCTTTFTATGSYTITAEYLGSAGMYNASAISASITQVVNAGATSTSLASSDTTAVVGQAITYTATVTATSPSTGNPTGNVEFFDGGTAISGCTAKALSGTGTDIATCVVTYASTTPSSHTITAQYLGNAGTYAASAVSNAVTETVSAASTKTTLASSDTTAVPGQTITYTATVSVTAPGGGTPSVADTVTFKSNGSAITCGVGSALFNGTTATCTVVYTSTSPSSYSITAVFGGDANYLTSTSSVLTETVGTAPTTTAVTSGTNPSVTGQSVTFTATVSVTAPGAGNPTGTVEFYNGGTAISGCTAQTLSPTLETATCTTSLTATGSTDTITAKYSGDANFAASTSPNFAQTVNAGATSASVVSSDLTAVVGQPITYTATVTATSPATGNPTGDVEFLSAGTAIAGCRGAGGVAVSGTLPDTATCTVTYASDSPSSYAITVKYLGTAAYSASAVSASITETVGLGATSTTVVSTTGSPSDVAEAVTYEATVTATSPSTGNPTGSVEFFDGGTGITGCTAQALSGTSPDTATCTVTYTTSGSHAITAQYLGATNVYAASAVSAPITQTVGASSTTTAVVSSGNPSVVGQSVTYTATVSVTAPGSGSPTGSVEFFDGGTGITGCTAKALSGTSPDTATCTIAYATVGTHVITAQYLGAAGAYNASPVSASITQTVNKAATVTAVTSSSAPSVVGQPVTYTATVSVTSPGSGTPLSSDTLTFEDGGTAISCGSSTAFNGTTATCTVTYTGTSGSPHSITAVFGGDANYSGSTSSVDSQVVDTASTTSSVISNSDPSTIGQTVTYTATISVNSPGAGALPNTDTVTFKDGATTISCSTGSATFNGSTATCKVTYANTTGSPHSITAVFSGDANFAGSTSPVLTQTVNDAGTTTAVTSSLSSIVVGQSTTLTATISVVTPGAGSPTGTVDFENAGVGITGCTAQVVSTPAETATCTFTPTTTGGASSHLITAVYSGDSNFLGSTSPAITETITVGATFHRAGFQ